VRVVVVGCGRVGAGLAAAGDACEPSVVDRVGLESVDTVVAATGDDEDNLVVSLLAKRWYAVPGWWPGSTTPRTPGCSPTTGGSTPPSRPRPPGRGHRGRRGLVRGDQVLAGPEAGPFEPADEVLALTTLQAEPDLRRLLGGQLGGSHTPAG
jgi:hypothetical protein